MLHVRDGEGRSWSTLDLFPPDMKRFTRNHEPFGDIDASNSSFQILGAKAKFNNIRLLTDKLTFEGATRIVTPKDRYSGLDCSGKN